MQLAACAELRLLALDALRTTLTQLAVGESSEADAVHLLAGHLRDRGVSEYWYPVGEDAGASHFGCAAVFDTGGDPQRSAVSSLRRWTASATTRWEGLGYFYASPQATVAGGVVAWGDIGCVLYTGPDEAVRRCLRAVWARNRTVLDRLGELAEPTTGDLWRLHNEESARLGLVNVAWSASGAGRNIGHDFPLSTEEGVGCEELPSRRTFIDGHTDRPLRGRLWTYEPREQVAGYAYGTVNYHEVVTKQADRIVRLPSYGDLFSVVGMEWMLA